MVLEAYSDLYRTTGVTYQASNQTDETTVLGPMVDVNVLPIFSQWGRLDWGVKLYDPGTNGGIAGTVFYDTVRAEDDGAYAGAEPWQPGIPDLELQPLRHRQRCQRRLCVSRPMAPTRRARCSTRPLPRTMSGPRTASRST